MEGGGCLLIQWFLLLIYLWVCCKDVKTGIDFCEVYEVQSSIHLHKSENEKLQDKFLTYTKYLSKVFLRGQY